MAATNNATRRLLFIIGGIVVVFILLIVVLSATGVVGGGPDATKVETVSAEARTITQVVTASGKVQPEVEVIISPDVSGEVIQLPVREGDRVRKGQLLARIQPDFYVAQAEQSEANVLQAKATMAQRRADMLRAESELKRQRDLFEKKVISQSEFEQAQTAFEVAKAGYEAAQYSVQSAEARRRESRENLSKTSLYAPMDGTVSKLDIELGERVVGTSQMQGTEMMRVARLDQMELEIDVNENDVVNVAEGDTATIEVDAYPDKTFRGVVTEIANSARVSGAGTQEQVTNFLVKVRILDPHNAEARVSSGASGALEQEVPLSTADYTSFRPGMSGTVDIYTETVQDVIAVPIQAVTVRDFNKVDAPRTRDDEDSEDEADEDTDAAFAAVEDLRKVLFVVDEGEARMLEVQTGIADDTHIEIRSGLEGGETVIIGPYRVVSRTLEPGDAVESENEDKRRADAVASVR